ncbi:MAG: hypothetical protein U9R60_09500 [Bacteroidota bacterium]|nr:hypothetical protein [Bacteroidota bacterium]
MNFIDIPTEQTTAATDFILGILAVWSAYKIYKAGHHSSPVKARIWKWVFILLALAAFFGAIAHGFQMDERINFILWQPLNFALGLGISLFAAGAILDLRQGSMPGGIVPGLLALGFIFYFITVLIPGTFLVFIIYEAVVMLFALIAYIVLASGQQLNGAWWMVSGIFISIIAAVIQATGSVKIMVFWEFDHNGIFHVVQMFGIILLLKGLLSTVQLPTANCPTAN